MQPVDRTDRLTTVVHHRAQRARERLARLPIRQRRVGAPHLAGRAVPGVRGIDPHGSAGGPECVLVSDLPKVTERTPTLENSQFAAGGGELAGDCQEETRASMFRYGLTWVHR
jgi:hypothetical protein